MSDSEELDADANDNVAIAAEVTIGAAIIHIQQPRRHRSHS